MKSVLTAIRKKIDSIKLVDARFISVQGKAFPSNPTNETIGKNLFVELFSEIELKKNFLDKRFLVGINKANCFAPSIFVIQAGKF